MPADPADAPDLQIYVPARPGLRVSAEFRVGMDGQSVSWTAGPWTPAPLDVITDKIALPVEAYWSEEQIARLSSLTVQVFGWSGELLTFTSGLTPLRRV